MRSYPSYTQPVDHHGDGYALDGATTDAPTITARMTAAARPARAGSSGVRPRSPASRNHRPACAGKHLRRTGGAAKLTSGRKIQSRSGRGEM